MQETSPARTLRCCMRKEGDMTRPVLAMKRDRKKLRTFSSWFKACSCWSVVLNITPATKAPNSVESP